MRIELNFVVVVVVVVVRQGELQANSVECNA